MACVDEAVSTSFDMRQDGKWRRTLMAQPPTAMPAGVLAAAQLATAERRRLAPPRAVRLSTVASGLYLMAQTCMIRDVCCLVHDWQSASMIYLGQMAGCLFVPGPHDALRMRTAKPPHVMGGAA